MNTLYTYLVGQGKTYNGYMILNLNASSHSVVDNGYDESSTGFTGKAMYIVDDKFNINGHWPHSQTISNIQIIDVRGTAGALQSWGWTYGNFSGIFYWENPGCSSTNGTYSLDLPNSGNIWYGAFLMGKNKTGCEVKVTPNSSNITLQLSQAVFTDIGVNLPNVLRAGVNADGTTNSTTTTTTKTVTTPLLRQVTDKPFFEAKGIYR